MSVAVSMRSVLLVAVMTSSVVPMALFSMETLRREVMSSSMWWLSILARDTGLPRLDRTEHTHVTVLVRTLSCGRGTNM